MGDLDDLDLEAELASMAMEVEGAAGAPEEDPAQGAPPEPTERADAGKGKDADESSVEEAGIDILSTEEDDEKENGHTSGRDAKAARRGDAKTDAGAAEGGDQASDGSAEAGGEGGAGALEEDCRDAAGEHSSDSTALERTNTWSASGSSAGQKSRAPTSPATAASATSRGALSVASRPASPARAPSSPARPSFARPGSRRPMLNVQAKAAQPAPALAKAKPTAAQPARPLAKPSAPQASSSGEAKPSAPARGVPAARVVASDLVLDPADEYGRDPLGTLADAATEGGNVADDRGGRDSAQTPKETSAPPAEAPKSTTESPDKTLIDTTASPVAAPTKPSPPKPAAPAVARPGRRAFSLAQAPAVAVAVTAATSPTPAAPAAPKGRAKGVRGRNAFFFFSEARREDVKALHPTLRSCEIVSKLGAMYRALTPDERVVYEAMARENVAAATLASAAASKTTTAAPKPPVPSTVAVKTPFQLFCDDLRPSLTADNPRAGTVEIAKLLAAAWRDAPEEDKAIYSAQHQELRAEAKKAGNVPTTTAATPPAKTAGKGKGKGSRGKKRKGAPQDEDESKAAQEPEEPDSDDEDRRTCDWVAHPPSFIISEDASRDMYLVARKGLPLQEYGVVAASEAKAARLDGRACVLNAALIDAFEGFRKRFLADVHKSQDMGELDLERLAPDSTLEACAILGTLREGGRELASKDKRDIWMKVPLLAMCRVVQWLVENARKQGERDARDAPYGKSAAGGKEATASTSALEHEP